MTAGTRKATSRTARLGWIILRIAVFGCALATGASLLAGFQGRIALAAAFSGIAATSAVFVVGGWLMAIVAERGPDG